MLYKFFPGTPVSHLVFNDVSVERVAKALFEIAKNRKSVNFEEIAVSELNKLVQEICPTHDPSKPLFVSEFVGGPPQFKRGTLLQHNRHYLVEKSPIRMPSGETVNAATKNLRLVLQSREYNAGQITPTGHLYAEETLHFLKEMIIAQELSSSGLGPELLFCDFDLFQSNIQGKPTDCMSIKMSTKFMDMGDGFIFTGKLIELLDGGDRKLEYKFLNLINDALRDLEIDTKGRYQTLEPAVRDLRLYVAKQIIDKYIETCEEKRVLLKDVKIENLLLDSKDGVVFWDFAGYGPVDNPEVRADWRATTADKAPPEQTAKKDTFYARREGTISTADRIAILKKAHRRSSADFMQEVFDKAKEIDLSSVAEASVVYMVFHAIHDVLEGDYLKEKLAATEVEYAKAEVEISTTEEELNASEALRRGSLIASHSTMFHRRASMIDLAMDRTVPKGEALHQREFLGMGLDREPEGRITPDQIKSTKFYEMLEQRFKNPHLGPTLMKAFKPVFDELPDVS